MKGEGFLTDSRKEEEVTIRNLMNRCIPTSSLVTIASLATLATRIFTMGADTDNFPEKR